MAPTAEEIRALFEMARSGPIVAERIARADGFDPERRWVKEDGSRLSDRLWKARAWDRQQIDALLVNAIRTGEDALVTAKKLEQFLDPAFAPIRTERGRLVRGQRRAIVTQAPGRGGSGSFPARRLARTEVSRAHGAGTVAAAEKSPFVRGVRWLLSGRHPRSDECDANASRDVGLGPGVYPPDAVPRYPQHPQDLCTLAPAVVEDTDAVVDQLRREFGLERAEEPPTRPIEPPVPRFKTAAEAEAWLTANLAEDVKMGKQSVAALQSLVDGLAESLMPYRVRLGTVDFTTGGRGNAMGRYQLRGDTGSILFQPTATASPSAGKRIAEKAQRVFAQKKTAEIGRLRAALADPRRAALVDYSRPKLARLEATERWASYADVSDPLKAVATHEAAHAVYFQRGIRGAWQRRIENLTGPERGAVSDYGATNPDELFAESFTLRRFGIPMPQAVEEALDDVLRAIE
jgi:hypothetical protein